MFTIMLRDDPTITRLLTDGLPKPAKPAGEAEILFESRQQRRARERAELKEWAR